MKKYNVIGINECGEEFQADTINVPDTDDFTHEQFAYIILEKRLESYKERYNEEINVNNFYVEPDFSTMSFYELQEYNQYNESY